MAAKVRIDGLRELEKALAGLPKATGKSVLRRVLKKRAQPVADAMQAGAPSEDGQLKASIAVSTKLSKRQKGLHKKFGGKAAVEMFVGAGPVPQAHNQEFGNVNHGPQPFARPAWDAGQGAVLEGLKGDIWAEIKKAAARLAKKQAKAAARG
jgi:HK97 gp10 family phage protein